MNVEFLLLPGGTMLRAIIPRYGLEPARPGGKQVPLSYVKPLALWRRGVLVNIWEGDGCGDVAAFFSTEATQNGNFLVNEIPHWRAEKWGSGFQMLIWGNSRGKLEVRSWKLAGGGEAMMKRLIGAAGDWAIERLGGGVGVAGQSGKWGEAHIPDLYGCRSQRSALATGNTNIASSSGIGPSGH